MRERDLNEYLFWTASALFMLIAIDSSDVEAFLSSIAFAVVASARRLVSEKN